VIWRDN